MAPAVDPIAAVWGTDAWAPLLLGRHGGRTAFAENQIYVKLYDTLFHKFDGGGSQDAAEGTQRFHGVEEAHVALHPAYRAERKRPPDLCLAEVHAAFYDSKVPSYNSRTPCTRDLLLRVANLGIGLSARSFMRGPPSYK